MSKIYSLSIGLIMLGPILLPTFNTAKAQDDVFTEIRKQATATREGAGYAEIPAGESGFLQARVGAIIKAALGLLGTVFLGFLVYAGYLWMTAGGNEEEVTKAKKLITQAIIGLAIVLAAYAITAFVVRGLVNATVTP